MKKSMASLSAAVLLITTVSLNLGATNAYGEEANLAAEQLRNLAAQVDDHKVDVLENLAVSSVEDSASGGIQAVSGDSTVVLPGDTSLPITLSDGTSHEISVTLPFSAEGNQAAPIAKSAELFSSQNGTKTVSAIKSDGSVEIATFIESAAGPSEFEYHVNGPIGFKLVLNKSDEGVSILDANGKWVGGFAPAWAYDSSGAKVETKYIIRGKSLIQWVDISKANIEFPVIADPWLGIDLIADAKWDLRYDLVYSPTLRVFPTLWGRGAPIIANDAAWQETLDRAPYQAHVTANTPTMHIQFDCHWLFVRVKDYWKDSWNLDARRPYADLATQFNYSCNVPG
jgi:hypothetical protein